MPASSATVLGAEPGTFVPCGWMLLPVDGEGLVPPLGSQTALASGARKASQDPVVWYLRSAASASWVRYLSPPGLLPCS